MEAARILGAKFVEELGGVHVRSGLKPAGYQRPDQLKRMLPTDVTSCKLLSLVILIVALQHEKEDESDEEYRSDTDVHKNLRFYFRVFIGTQAHALVGGATART